MSIARALILSGCSCVVGSTWPIAGDGMSELVSKFYDSLRKGSSPARALQGARSRLRDLGTGRRAWMGLQVLGDADDVDSDRFDVQRLKESEHEHDD